MSTTDLDARNRKSFLSLPPSPTPISVTHTGHNMLAIVLPLVSTYWAALNLPALDVALIAIATTVVAFLVLEIFVHKAHLHDESGLCFAAANWSLNRSITKLIGFLAIIGTICFLYWLLPEYAKKLYSSSFSALKILGWLLLVLAIPYFSVVDAFQKQPCDHYWQLGRCLMGKGPLVEVKQEVNQLLLGWAVKAFFLPLMFAFLMSHVESIQAGAMNIKHSIEHVMFGIDVMIGTVGYLMTLRVIGTHIRSTEPTLLGWSVALMCYPPFNDVFFHDYLSYRSFLDFVIHDECYFVFGYLLEFVSLITLFIYTLATVSFGMRFSNLTHRGIITGGPYRYWKHPAYLAKNLFWWTEVITYLPMNLAAAIKAIVLMAGVSLVYWARAKTEERHLRRDPKYVEYEAWIAQHGFWGRLKHPRLHSVGEG